MLLRSTFPQVPLIANGDFYQIIDTKRIIEKIGASGVMLARPALFNISVFRQYRESLACSSLAQLLPLEAVITQYLQECVRWELPYQTAKYTVSIEISASRLIIELYLNVWWHSQVMEMLNDRRHPKEYRGKPDLGPGRSIADVAVTKSLVELLALFDEGYVSTDQGELTADSEPLTKKHRLT
jgi:tRNA-dihydrouridine synthase